MVYQLWKTIWRFLKKLKIELPYDPEIPVLGIYAKKIKSVPHKDICAPIFIAALFTIAEIQKQPKCPLMNDWVKKYLYVHTMKYYSALKKEGDSAICDNMHENGRHYAKWN